MHTAVSKSWDIPILNSSFVPSCDEIDFWMLDSIKNSELVFFSACEFANDPMVINPCKMRCGHWFRTCRHIPRASDGVQPDLTSSPDHINVNSQQPGLSIPEVFTWMHTRRDLPSNSLALFRRSAFFMVSTDSTIQRFGIWASVLHLFVCSCPMKCHRMSCGRRGAFSMSSARYD